MTIPLAPAPKGQCPWTSTCRSIPGRQISSNNDDQLHRRTGTANGGVEVAYLALPNLRRGRRCGRRAPGGDYGAPHRDGHDAILAVEGGEADRVLVPFGARSRASVAAPSTLAFDADAVTIVGEHDFTSTPT